MELKFSIITPSFNSEKYIYDTIEYVLSQNYNEIEHIVIDGGSTDGTIEILKKNTHLKWLSEPDKGAAEAINKGLKMASGKIVAWINSDDYFEKNILKDVLNVFNDNDNIDIVYGNLTFVNEDKSVIRAETTEKYDLNYLIHKNADAIRQPCTFFRRRLLEKIGLLDEKLKCAFDYDFILRFLLNSESYYINRNLAYYRDYENTLTRKYLKLQGIEIIKIARKYGAKIFDKIVLSNFVKKVMFSKIFFP
jgi:glycosyltransferase involved in cell wall biosynthesis